LSPTRETSKISIRRSYDADDSLHVIAPLWDGRQVREHDAANSRDSDTSSTVVRTKRGSDTYLLLDLAPYWLNARLRVRHKTSLPAAACPIEHRAIAAQGQWAVVTARAASLAVPIVMPLLAEL
jgi:hypothetical protein